MQDLAAILDQLKDYCGRLDAAIGALESQTYYRGYKRRRVFVAPSADRRKTKRPHSAATKRKLSEAAKARWAKVKLAGKNRL